MPNQFDMMSPIEALRVREGQQAAVAHLGQLALSGSDIDKLCDEAVMALSEHLNVEMAKVLERSATSDTLLLKAGVGWHDGLVGSAEIPTGEDSQAGFTLRSAVPVIVSDLATETRFSGPALLTEHGVISGLSVVIEGRPNSYGVLGAHTGEQRAFSIDDVHFLQAVANVIGAAVKRNDAELGLQEANHRLERVVRSKNDFVAAVAHELRTPMAAVLGLSVELDNRYQEFEEIERRDLIGTIARQSSEVASIVEDLLVAARSDIGGVTVDTRIVHLRQVVDEAAATFGATGHPPITVDIDDSIRALADPARVRQVVRNLLSNAFRYGGRTVQVSTSASNGLVAIDVWDDGEGIAQEDRERIFMPYERAHEIATQPASVGLGLSVSKTLAGLMGGDLDYVDTSAGSAFRLSLPTG